SGRSASMVRSSVASPSGVFGGKNSNEMSGPPRRRRSVIFTGPRPGYLESFHTALALATEDAKTFVELPEVLVDAHLVVDRVQEEVAETRHGEAERGETELVRKRVPLRERERAQRLVASDERLEALEAVLLAVEAERVHGGRQVEDELAARRGLE